VARRNRTLIDMLVTHKITARQEAAAKAELLEAVPFSPQNQRILAPASAHVEWFVSYVTQKLIASYRESVVYGGGLKVRTSLDLDLQQKAYDSVYGKAGLVSNKGPAGALVTLDNTGAVKAMVAGRDYSVSKVNLAVGTGGGGSGRQPGSTMKPILLAQIVDEGYSVLSSFRAPPQLTLKKANAGADWTVSNFDNEDFSGPDGQGTLNLIDATKNSVNTVYAQAVVAIKPSNMANMAYRLGLGVLPPYASLVLGTVDESVLNMAGAYSVFADDGIYNEPHTILEVHDKGGAPLPLQLTSKAVLRKDETDVITHCLRQVVLGGTGTTAGFGHPVAGKTGTTEQNTDAWFVGYTHGPQHLTTAVWMGYPDRAEPMVNLFGFKAITGGTVPADIFRRFMSSALANTPVVNFDEPAGFPGKNLAAPASVVFPTTTTTSTTSTTSTTTTSTVPPGSATTEPGHAPTTAARPPVSPPPVTAVSPKLTVISPTAQSG